MSCELQGVEWRSILPTKLVATATSLEGSKNNCISKCTTELSSTNPANFVKISPVNVEVINLTRITKKYFLNHQQNISGWVKINLCTCIALCKLSQKARHSTSGRYFSKCKPLQKIFTGRFPRKLLCSAISGKVFQLTSTALL